MTVAQWRMSLYKWDLLAGICSHVQKAHKIVSIDMDQKCNNIYVSNCISVFKNVRMLKNLISLKIW